MSNKLFVGGLSWNTTSDNLRDAFAEHGDITEATVITDRDTGRSRGFGFVTFSNSNDAASAIRELDGTDLDGRTINVNVAQDRRNDRAGGGGGGRGGASRGGRW